MKTRISTAALALGMVSGAATAGPLADLLANVTGGGSITNTLISNFNNPDNPFLGFTGPLTAGGDSLVGIGAFESDATGNGQLAGIGIGNDNQGGNSGSGALVGLGALQSGQSGNSDLIGIGAITGDNSGSGGLVGLSALSSGGGNSGQGGLIGAEVLNGDTVLGLNSGQAGQSADIIPNPTGMSATELNNVAAAPLRDGLQGALQRGGEVSGPLEGALVGLDDALVSQLGDGLAPVTDSLGDLAGVGIDSTGDSKGGFASLANAVVTGDSSGGNGSDVNAGVIGGDNQGDGSVVGAGAFSGDNAGGGVASVGAISGGNSGKNGDANVGVANDGTGATRNGGGLLSAGVANSGSGTNNCPTGNCGRPNPPTTNTPNILVTNGKAEENCSAGSEHNETGLKGAAQLTQFNSRNAKEDGCSDTRLQQLTSKL